MHRLSSSKTFPSTRSVVLMLFTAVDFAMLSLDLVFSFDPNVSFSSSDVVFSEVGSLKLSLCRREKIQLMNRTNSKYIQE